MAFDEIVYERAAELEERTRQAGIDEARAAPPEPPRERDGKRYCLDCDTTIEGARLAARPEAVRCVPCQERHERRRG